MSRIEDKKWGRAGKRRNEEEAFPIKGKTKLRNLIQSFASYETQSFVKKKTFPVKMESNDDNPFAESPKLGPGTFFMIFGQSQSGKSYFLKVKNFCFSNYFEIFSIKV